MLLVGVVNSDCLGEFEVHTIYFRPADAPPNTDYNIDLWMKGTRELFRSEMIRNGFGNKTFNMNTDNQGNVKVNIVNGQHNSNHYQNGDTWASISSEIPAKFKSQDNVHVIIIGKVNAVNGNSWGVGFPFHSNRYGGNCWIASECRENNDQFIELIFHEMGHTFGLYHKPPGSKADQLKHYESRWLSEHHLFNNDHGNRGWNGSLPKVLKTHDTISKTQDLITMKFDLEGLNDLHQSQIFRKSNILMLGHFYQDGNENESATFDISRTLVNKNDTIVLQVMDKDGNYIMQDIELQVPDHIDENTDKNKTSKPEIIAEDTSENVVYLTINSGTKTLPNENGLMPFNPVREYKNGWGWQSISDNRTNNRNPIVIRNTTFKRGISLSPPDHPRVSSLKYNLQRNNYVVFEGYIGITNDRVFEIDKHNNASCRVGGSCIFRFEIDGVEEYKSKLMTGNDNYEKVNFIIPFDAKELSIIFSSGPDGSWCDHPAIGDAKLISNSSIQYSLKPEGKLVISWARIKSLR